MIIRLKNIRVETVIGVHEFERHKKQPLVINATIEYDGAKAAKTDTIDDTIDYLSLTQEIKEKVENTEFELLEKLVECILKIIMTRSLVQRAEVEIDKPEALKDYADSVSVSGTSER